jgi:hypothetical protein
MSLPLAVLTVLVSELVITTVLLRWLPVKQERWIPGLPFPVVVVLVLLLRFAAELPWAAACAASAAFLWGIVAALAPFRGWVSSWTLPVRGEARLRWHEAAWVVLGVVTPRSPKRAETAMEKAFAIRQVVRARGPFPVLLGVSLLVVPVVCAVGAGWAVAARG